MKIWVDADACPAVIKEILFKAASRAKVATFLVANQWLNIPKSNFLSFIKVDKGADVADNYIVSCLNKEDLVITADIPLASAVIQRGGFALNPRGKLYTKDNIKEILSARNFMEELRNSNQISGGLDAINNKDKQAFANSLDRFLTASKK